MLDAGAAESGWGVELSSSASNIPYTGPLLMSFARVGRGVDGGGEVGTSTTDSGAIEPMRPLGNVSDDDSLGCGMSAGCCGCS